MVHVKDYCACERPLKNVNKTFLSEADGGCIFSLTLGLQYMLVLHFPN
jgi:hypothetical protein